MALCLQEVNKKNSVKKKIQLSCCSRQLNSRDITRSLETGFISAGVHKGERDSEAERRWQKMLPSGKTSCGSTAISGFSKGNTGAT